MTNNIKSSAQLHYQSLPWYIARDFEGQLQTTEIPEKFVEKVFLARCVNGNCQPSTVPNTVSKVVFEKCHKIAKCEQTVMDNNIIQGERSCAKRL